MKKRIIVLISVLVLINVTVFGDWVALYEGWEGHPRIADGMIPTSLSMGLAHRWASRTEIYFQGNAGYHERLLWQDPLSGAIRASDPLIYDYMGLNLGIGVNQRIGKHMINGGFAVSFERALDSVITGTVLESGTVMPFDSWSPSTVYGQIEGLGLSANIGYRYDDLIDRRTAAHGLRGNLLLSYTFGAETWSIIGEAMGMLTVFQQQENEQNLFSIILADRMVASYVFGKSIALPVQEQTSFGSKIRGFGTFQYPTSFSMANQFDIRINGPEAIYKGIFPRLVLFFDIGYGLGHVGNSTFWANGILSSAGGSLFFTLGPVMDFGYQMAYLISGTNPEHPGAKMVGQLVAHLTY